MLSRSLRVVTLVTAAMLLSSIAWGDSVLGTGRFQSGRVAFHPGSYFHNASWNRQLSAPTQSHSALFPRPAKRQGSGIVYPGLSSRNRNNNLTTCVRQVPEPSSLSMLVIGAAALAWAIRRKALANTS